MTSGETGELGRIDVRVFGVKLAEWLSRFDLPNFH
jgi:hypothetical protein